MRIYVLFDYDEIVCYFENEETASAFLEQLRKRFSDEDEKTRFQVEIADHFFDVDWKSLTK